MNLPLPPKTSSGNSLRWRQLNTRLNKKNIRNRGIIGDEVMVLMTARTRYFGTPKETIPPCRCQRHLTRPHCGQHRQHEIRMTVERIQRESPDTKLYLRKVPAFR